MYAVWMVDQDDWERLVCVEADEDTAYRIAENLAEDFPEYELILEEFEPVSEHAMRQYQKALDSVPAGATVTGESLLAWLDYLQGIHCDYIQREPSQPQPKAALPPGQPGAQPSQPPPQQQQLQAPGIPHHTDGQSPLSPRPRQTFTPKPRPPRS